MPTTTDFDELERCEPLLRNAAGSSARTTAVSNARTSRPRSLPERPLFLCNWEHVLFVHYVLPPRVLQPHVPFALDVRDGRAFVSLVAFTMTDLRPAVGGRLAAWLFRPFREQHFLNVRTYVRHHHEPGIYFLAEWMSDWLCVRLGPLLYGLPYRWGSHKYSHDEANGAHHVTVREHAGPGTLTASVSPLDSAPPAVCKPHSPAAFLLERYTAFTRHAGPPRLFRIGHEPWEQCAVRVQLDDDTLVRRPFPWWECTEAAGAHFSRGAFGIRMGRPRRCR
jgi:uncharacterized protein